MPIRLLVTIVAAMVLFGCASVPKNFVEEAWGQNLFGRQPSNTDILVKDAIERYFVDPDSVTHLQVFEPYPVALIVPPSILYGGQKAWCGYVVPFEANAKNKMGGYTGISKSYVYVRDWEIHDMRRSAPSPSGELPPDMRMHQTDPIGGDFRHYYRKRGDQWVLPEG